MQGMFLKIGVICNVVLLLQLLWPMVATAEIYRTVTRGSYILDESANETMASAKENARKEAMRLAIEEAGMYVSSVSVSNNMQLEKDVVVGLACGILKIENEKCVANILNDHMIQYTVTLESIVDFDEAVLQARVQDRKQLQESVKKFQELVQETQQIRTSNERRKQKLQSAIFATSIENEKKAERESRIHRINQTLKNNQGGQGARYVDITPFGSNEGYYMDLRNAVVVYSHQQKEGRFILLKELSNDAGQGGYVYELWKLNCKMDFGEGGKKQVAWRLVSAWNWEVNAKQEERQDTLNWQDCPEGSLLDQLGEASFSLYNRKEAILGMA